jgi:methylenetetrahydrofolate reductase (NADPH)
MVASVVAVEWNDIEVPGVACTFPVGTIGLTVMPATGRPGTGGPEADPMCPKRMVYGPCGGVRVGGGCELDDGLSCPFVGSDLVKWAGESTFPVVSMDVPMVMTDLRVRAFDAVGIRKVAAIVGATADAVLIGDHQNRPDFPPAFVAALLLEVGARPWPVLTCRDRNRVALEAEIASLAAMGVTGAHCVTGDARGSGVRSDAGGVFDLDSLRLASLAASWGLIVSVAATPAAPPYDLRPRRVVEKQRAGASLCIVNHAGGTAALSGFAHAARAAGCTLPLMACVAVFTDAASAAVLAGFPGLVLDEHRVEAVLRADDPVEAGIQAAVDDAWAVLQTGEFAGIDLSGAATAGDELTSASILAETVLRLQERLTR